MYEHVETHSAIITVIICALHITLCRISRFIFFSFLRSFFFSQFLRHHIQLCVVHRTTPQIFSYFPLFFCVFVFLLFFQGGSFGKLAVLTRDTAAVASRVSASGGASKGSGGDVLFAGEVPGIGTKVTTVLSLGWYRLSQSIN